MTSPITAVVSNEDWHYSPLTVVVIGASGDLAKKKTYPSLLSLYAGGLLPKEVQVRGYARSAKTNEQFRDGLRPYLEKTAVEKGVGTEVLEGFLEKCFYAYGGSYDDLEAFERLEGEIRGFEAQVSEERSQTREGGARRQWGTDGKGGGCCGKMTCLA